MTKSIAGAILIVVSCYANEPLPFTPATPTTDLAVPPSGWVYRQGAVTARRAKQGPTRPPTAEEVRMVGEGYALANAVLVSDCFKQGVLAAKMSHTKGETNEAIYATMATGEPATLPLELYDGSAAHGTDGYEDPRDAPLIHVNTYFIKDSYRIADVLLHEAAHVRGYIHKSAREHASVPYTMNHIFEACLPNRAPALQLDDSE